MEPERKKYDLNSVDSWSATEIRQETFAYRWDIGNFKSAIGLDTIVSNEFQGGKENDHRWRLVLNPKKKIENTEYFSIFLRLVKLGKKGLNNNKVNARFQFSILNKADKPVIQLGDEKMDIYIFSEFSELGYKKFMKSSQLMNYGYAVDDMLRIHCRVWILSSNHKGGEVIGPKAERGKDVLSSDLKRLLNSSFESDVIIATSTKSFKAHKVILSCKCRSAVFAAMFRNGVLESFCNLIEIRDFGDDVVQGMLEYIYSGEVVRKEEKAKELIRIAERYDIRGLKEDCLSSVVTNMTIENAAEMLLLADQCNSTELKAKAINFINTNKEFVKNTASFQQLTISAPALLVDLYLSS